ncbi:hypothetical protein [Sphingobacterium sp. LRF_L2]|uniref:hypothetical protein n=1 Tax=Sphingobacterium sp. LRF_L2 TaxID=3369421 RepID=UPI003F611F39
MNLKHFKRAGNLYKMKPQYGFGIILIIGLLLSAFGAYYADINGLMWIMLTLGILSLWALISKKLHIAMDKRELYAKVGLVKPPVCISIDNIQRFELFTMSTHFFKTNAILSAYYLDENGKEKAIQIAQGFTVKTMQSILNEMEEIIGDER